MNLTFFIVNSRLGLTL